MISAQTKGPTALRQHIRKRIRGHDQSAAKAERTGVSQRQPKDSLDSTLVAWTHGWWRSSTFERIARARTASLRRQGRRHLGRCFFLQLVKGISFLLVEAIQVREFGKVNEMTVTVFARSLGVNLLDQVRIRHFAPIRFRPDPFVERFKDQWHGMALRILRRTVLHGRRPNNVPQRL